MPKKTSKPAEGSELNLLYEILKDPSAIGKMDANDGGIMAVLSNWYALVKSSHENPKFTATQRNYIKTRLYKLGENGIKWWAEFEKRAAEQKKEPVSNDEFEKLKIENAVLKHAQQHGVAEIRKKVEENNKLLKDIWESLPDLKKD